jgi:hypothetical protein
MNEAQPATAGQSRTGYYAVLTAICTIFLGIIVFFDSSYGGYDNWKHYLISRHLYAHPELGLDTWGKPLFTVLASPFAYFGFKGAQLFNLITCLLFILSARRILNFLGVERHWSEPIFMVGAPVYFACVTSALTEPLFVLFLVFSIELFLKERKIFAILLLSCLPFIRNEGYFMWLPFGLLCLNRRDWWKGVFFAGGTLLFAIITGIVHGDLLYVIKSNHYLNHDGHYGSGTWFHFFRLMPLWFGLAGCVLLIAYFIPRKGKSEITDGEKWKQFHLLTMGCFLIYLFLHVVFWALGIMGSLGLERVMAGNSALGFLALYAWLQSRKFNNNKRLWHYAPVFLIVFQMSLLVYIIRPYSLDGTGEMNLKASNWIRENVDIASTRVHLFDPFTIVYLDLDSYDQSRCGEISANPATHQFESGDIILWDVYCDSECGLEEKVFEDGNYTKLYSDQDSTLITYKGVHYKLTIYRKN